MIRSLSPQLRAPGMNLDPIDALSPVDGRYARATAALRAHLSEAALIRERVRVEAEWLLTLARTRPAGLAGVEALTPAVLAVAESLAKEPPAGATAAIKAIESRTNHDVKAVEYYVHDQLATAGASAAVRVKDEVWISGASTDASHGDFDTETATLTGVIVRRLEALGGKQSDLVLLSAYVRDLAIAETAGLSVETFPGVLPPMMVEADPVLDSADLTIEARAFIRGDQGVSN